MTTLTDQISRREEWVVASLLDNLGKPWGPNVCTALAHAGYWQNPVARMLASAINLSRTNLTRANIATRLGHKDSEWLWHPTYYENGLPLDLAEYEAYELCVFYRGKRLERIVGEAWQRIRQHPEQGKIVAQGLVDSLRDYL